MTKTITLELPDDLEQALERRSTRHQEDESSLILRMIAEGLTHRKANWEYAAEGQIPGFGELFPAKEYLVDISRGAIYDDRRDSDQITPEEIADYRREQIAEARQHLDKLVTEQQIGPFAWPDPVRYGHWPDEETALGFVASIRESRRTSPPRERLP